MTNELDCELLTNNNFDRATNTGKKVMHSCVTNYQVITKIWLKELFSSCEHEI